MASDSITNAGTSLMRPSRMNRTFQVPEMLRLTWRAPTLAELTATSRCCCCDGTPTAIEPAVHQLRLLLQVKSWRLMALKPMLSVLPVLPPQSPIYILKSDVRAR